MACKINRSKRHPEINGVPSKIYADLMNTGVVDHENAVKMFDAAVSEAITNELYGGNNSEFSIEPMIEVSMKSDALTHEDYITFEAMNTDTGARSEIGRVYRSDTNTVTAVVTDLVLDNVLELDSNSTLKIKGDTVAKQFVNEQRATTAFGLVHDLSEVRLVGDRYEVTNTEPTLEGYTMETILEEATDSQIKKLRNSEKFVDFAADFILHKMRNKAAQKTTPLQSEVYTGLMKLAESMGIRVSEVSSITTKDGMTANGVADLLNAAIHLADGSTDVIFAEEVMHFVIEKLFVEGDPAILAMMEAITEETHGSEFSSKLSLEENRLEVIAKMAAQIIARDIKYDSESVFGKLTIIVKEFLDRLKNFYKASHTKELQKIVDKVRRHPEEFHTSTFQPVHYAMFNLSEEQLQNLLSAAAITMRGLAHVDSDVTDNYITIDQPSLDQIIVMIPNLNNHSSWEDILQEMTTIMEEAVLPLKGFFERNNADGSKVNKARVSRELAESFAVIRAVDALEGIAKSILPIVRELRANPVHGKSEALKVINHRLTDVVATLGLVGTATTTKIDFWSTLDEELDKLSLSDEQRQKVKDRAEEAAKAVTQLELSYGKMADSHEVEMNLFALLAGKASARANRISAKINEVLFKAAKGWTVTSFNKLREYVDGRMTRFLLSPYEFGRFEKEYEAFRVKEYNKLTGQNFKTWADYKKASEAGKALSVKELSKSKAARYYTATRAWRNERKVARVINKVKDDAYNKLSPLAKRVVDRYNDARGTLLKIDEGELFDSRKMTASDKIALQLAKRRFDSAASKIDWSTWKKKKGEALRLADELTAYIEELKSTEDQRISNDVLTQMTYETIREQVDKKNLSSASTARLNFIMRNLPDRIAAALNLDVNTVVRSAMKGSSMNDIVTTLAEELIVSLTLSEMHAVMSATGLSEAGLTDAVRMALIGTKVETEVQDLVNDRLDNAPVNPKVIYLEDSMTQVEVVNTVMVNNLAARLNMTVADVISTHNIGDLSRASTYSDLRALYASSLTQNDMRGIIAHHGSFSIEIVEGDIDESLVSTSAIRLTAQDKMDLGIGVGGSNIMGNIFDFNQHIYHGSSRIMSDESFDMLLANGSFISKSVGEFESAVDSALGIALKNPTATSPEQLQVLKDLVEVDKELREVLGAFKMVGTREVNAGAMSNDVRLRVKKLVDKKSALRSRVALLVALLNGEAILTDEEYAEVLAGNHDGIDSDTKSDLFEATMSLDAFDASPNEYYYVESAFSSSSEFFSKHLPTAKYKVYSQLENIESMFVDEMIEIGYAVDEADAKAKFKNPKLRALGIKMYGEKNLLPYFTLRTSKDVVALLKDHKNFDVEAILEGEHPTIEYLAPTYWNDHSSIDNPNYLGVDYLQLTDEYINDEFFDSMGVDKQHFLATGEIRARADQTSKQAKKHKMWEILVGMKEKAMEMSESTGGNKFAVPDVNKSKLDRARTSLSALARGRVMEFWQQLGHGLTDIVKTKGELEFGQKLSLHPLVYYLGGSMKDSEVASDLLASYSKMVAKAAHRQQLIGIMPRVVMLHERLKGRVAQSTVESDLTLRQMEENIDLLLFGEHMVGGEATGEALSYLDSIVTQYLLAFSLTIASSVLASSFLIQLMNSFMPHSPTTVMSTMKALGKRMSPLRAYKIARDLNNFRMKNKTFRATFQLGVEMSSELAENGGFSWILRNFVVSHMALLKIASNANTVHIFRTVTLGMRVIGNKVYTKEQASAVGLKGEWSKGEKVYKHLENDTRPKGISVAVWEDILDNIAIQVRDHLERVDGVVATENSPLALRTKVGKVTLSLRGWLLVSARRALQRGQVNLSVARTNQALLSNIGKSITTRKVKLTHKDLTNAIVGAIFTAFFGLMSGVAYNMDDEKDDTVQSYLELLAFYVMYRINDEVYSATVGGGITKTLDVVNGAIISMSTMWRNIKQGKKPKNYDYKGPYAIAKAKNSYAIYNPLSHIIPSSIRHYDKELSDQANYEQALSLGFDVVRDAYDLNVNSAKEYASFMKETIKLVKDLDKDAKAGSERIERTKTVRGWRKLLYRVDMVGLDRRLIERTGYEDDYLLHRDDVRHLQSLYNERSAEYSKGRIGEWRSKWVNGVFNFTDPVEVLSHLYYPTEKE